MPSPHTTRLAADVQALVDATVAADETATRAALAAVNHPVQELPRRASVPLGTTFEIFRRDSWTCRYCGGKTIPIAVLRLLSSLYPEEFPHHPNWKAGQVHPAYLLISTSLDHLQPGARGGGWNDPDNLVTSCWPCNTGKADFTLDELGWTLLSVADVRSDWSGLTSRYRALWEAAGRPDPDYHRQRLALLG
jgi:5-methylcytosine-specific restriction endonuclease McrA